MYAWTARLLSGANDTSSNQKRRFSRQRRPSRTKARFESLEPRALLSADPATQPAAAAVNSTPAAAAPYFLPGVPSDGTDQMFIRNVYRELLGREPDAAGDAFWVNYLQQAEQSSLANSAAPFGSTFNGFNSGFAGTATSNPTGNVTGPMDSYAGPLSGVSNVGPPSSFGTAGFGAGNTETNGFGASGFGTTVNTANAFATPGGTGTSPTTPRQQMVDAILSSAEYRQHLVTSVYESFLHRAPGAQATSYWSDQLAAGAGLNGLIVGIAGSTEYYADGGGTPSGFVQALYRDLLGRSAGASGVTYWTDRLNALDRGQEPASAAAARETLVRELLATPEAQQLLANNPTNSALAQVTGNGFNNLTFEQNMNAQAQNQFFAEFEGNPGYDTAVRDLLSHSTYLTGPGAGSNPGPSFGNPGSGMP